MENFANRLEALEVDEYSEASDKFQGRSAIIPQKVPSSTIMVKVPDYYSESTLGPRHMSSGRDTCTIIVRPPGKIPDGIASSIIDKNPDHSQRDSMSGPECQPKHPQVVKASIIENLPHGPSQKRNGSKSSVHYVQKEHGDTVGIKSVSRLCRDSLRLSLLNINSISHKKFNFLAEYLHRNQNAIIAVTELISETSASNISSLLTKHGKCPIL